MSPNRNEFSVYETYIVVMRDKGLPFSLSSQRRDRLAGDGSNRCVLRVYGAYGSRTLLPHFSRLDLALLDRGVVLAAAHVRGGGELGAAWRAAGRRMRKVNSVLDLLAAADALCVR